MNNNYESNFVRLHYFAINYIIMHLDMLILTTTQTHNRKLGAISTRAIITQKANYAFQCLKC